MPSIGRLHKYEEPRGIPGVRCDSGAEFTIGSVRNLEGFATEEPDPTEPIYSTTGVCFLLSLNIYFDWKGGGGEAIFTWLRVFARILIVLNQLLSFSKMKNFRENQRF